MEKPRILLDGYGFVWSLREFDLKQHEGFLEALIKTFYTNYPNIPEDSPKDQLPGPYRITIDLLEPSKLVGGDPQKVGEYVFFFDAVGKVTTIKQKEEGSIIH